MKRYLIARADPQTVASILVKAGYRAESVNGYYVQTNAGTWEVEAASLEALRS